MTWILNMSINSETALSLSIAKLLPIYANGIDDGFNNSVIYPVGFAVLLTIYLTFSRLADGFFKLQ